ncbi:DUF6368 family protein [Kitasatospora sp. NPDC056531]|uniref:DUF6368 family protein n=1 Tax=Kitasatospora sp. NPDC056531 TaxID=3345856 RepID=UPI0036A71A5D
MSGPAVGLWLFEPRGFADILADVVPWLETFCDPVETKASGSVDFWVRDGSPLNLRAFDPAGVGVFFLSVTQTGCAGRREAGKIGVCPSGTPANL